MRQHPTDINLKVQEYLTLRQKVQHILTKYGISEYELRIIEFLSKHAEYNIITANHITEQLNLDRGWVFKSLRNLEEREYITRTRGGWIHIGGRVTIILARVNACLRNVTNVSP